MKDPNCPNCHGRSFSAVDPGEPYICHLCEYPDASFVMWYCSEPNRLLAYEKWASIAVECACSHCSELVKPGDYTYPECVRCYANYDGKCS